MTSIVILLNENRDCVFLILYVKTGVQKNQEISRGLKQATAWATLMFENVFKIRKCMFLLLSGKVPPPPPGKFPPGKLPPGNIPPPRKSPPRGLGLELGLGVVTLVTLTLVTLTLVTLTLVALTPVGTFPRGTFPRGTFPRGDISRGNFLGGGDFSGGGLFLEPFLLLPL